MKICTNESIATIGLDDCVGTSLAVINTNFNLLKEVNCLTWENIQEKTIQIEKLQTQTSQLSSTSRAIPHSIIVFNASTIPPTLIKKSSKISGIDKLNVGQFKINFESETFPDSNYSIIGSCSETLSSSNHVWVQPTTSHTELSAGINIRNENGVFADPNYVSLTFFY